MSESASAFDIAASGMTAQRTQMDVIAANLANADVRRSDGVPYRAQTAVFEASNPAEEARDSFAAMLDVASGGSFDDLSLDDAPVPEGVRFAGYAVRPNEPVDAISQMIALVSAGRAYDADVSALQAAKQMDVETIDIEQG
jgi:flagellar basal-body rod protein FlgC